MTPLVEAINGVKHTTAYTYGDSDWGNLLTAYDGEKITYDKIGNPTSYYNGTRWSMSWKHGRELTTATDGTTNVSYAYDGTGMRISKTVDGTKYDYYYDGDRLLRLKIDGVVTMLFFYDFYGKPYAMYYNSTLLFFILNQQGDVVRLVTNQGESYATYRYDAWGNIIYQSPHAWMADNPLRYRGYVYDEETELYYCQSRYYDPQTGRFINADVYTSTGQGLLGNNMFAYCRNNPVCRIDITGTLDADCINETDDAVMDDKDAGRASGAHGSSSSGSYSYCPPNGGGGVTSSVQVGNTTVTFGHGGRHVESGDVSGLETAIANDVVTQPPTTGIRGEVLINYRGVDYTYRYWTMGGSHIHVGTYFYKVAY